MLTPSGASLMTEHQLRFVVDRPDATFCETEALVFPAITVSRVIRPRQRSARFLPGPRIPEPKTTSSGGDRCPGRLIEVEGCDRIPGSQRPGTLAPILPRPAKPMAVELPFRALSELIWLNFRFIEGL